MDRKFQRQDNVTNSENAKQSSQCVSTDAELQFTHFQCFVAFHYINIPRFIHFTVSRHLCSFQFLAIITVLPVTMGISLAVHMQDFLRVELLDHRVFSCVRILLNCLPKWLVGLVFTPKGVCDCNYSASSQTLGVPVTVTVGYMSQMTSQFVSAKILNQTNRFYSKCGSLRMGLKSYI